MLCSDMLSMSCLASIRQMATLTICRLVSSSLNFSGEQININFRFLVGILMCSVPIVAYENKVV
ncbi:MAG: hypothetical protein HRU05_07055 [Oceanospirillaceae bacterium]|nr:hypothetical protein [Oceanospirillaceae bacterium]